MYGYIGVCLAVEGYVWLCRAMSSCGGLCVAVEGYVCCGGVFIAVEGHVW